MTYAALQMFMEKLLQLINCNDNPFTNNPTIIYERPQLKLLYEDLGSMSQTLFVDEHHELEKVDGLKKRFAYIAGLAEHMVDLFLSGAHMRNNGHFPTSEDFKLSLTLDDVMGSLKSVKVEFMSMIADSIKIDSSRRPERMLNQSPAAQIGFTGNSLSSKRLLDEIVVGLDGDVERIRDKLVEDQKKLDVVSIVGMGGIGKTTLATKVFNDDYVKHHFHVRVWVTISQTYDKRDVMIQILASMRVKVDLEKDNDSKLCEMVYKHLMCRRYLIVIDDLWDRETWDNLKLYFPQDHHGSRILLTSRLTEVAKHANSDGLIHQLGHLNIEKSWELLCQKVFHENKCPEWSIKPGMQIVESCQGLPLAVVVIAGVVAKEAWSEPFWVDIAYRAGLYIASDRTGCLETLALSYNHLPPHLRHCFLYFGGFPEGHKFQVQRLICLWVAEGFIQQAGSRSLEDTAEGYLMDLIDRNLVIVVDRRKSNGAIKACKVHDLVRELCLRKAKEEKFILTIDKSLIDHFNYRFKTQSYMPCRMFINKNIHVPNFSHPVFQSLRSILCFSYFKSLSDDIVEYFRSFMLLRVLDLQNCRLSDFPKGMELLVHLRYLAISNSSASFPSSICNLWSLQTLIYITSYYRTVLPSNIPDLVNLRHLWSYHPLTKEPVGALSYKRSFCLPSIEKPMNLQTISSVMLGDGVGKFQKCFPCIKELRCNAYLDEENDFKSLSYLEKLKLSGLRRRMKSIVHDSQITFPTSLKTLTLVLCRLPWSDMSIIQSLPNLEVLKLRDDAFKGSRWNTNEQEFRQLKFLRLEWLNIEMWEVYSPSFPCLRQLEIFDCEDLEEIPLEIGDIPTLELIKINNCSQSVGESVTMIQQEQHDSGNISLKIDITQFAR